MPAKPKTAYQKLSLKQRLFVDAYLGVANGNASEAARIAGYAHPGQMGYQLLRETQGVQAAINERLKEAAMRPDEILARLTEQARALYAPFIDGEGNIDLAGLQEAGMMRLVKKISYDKNNNQVIEFHDVQAALVHLGRYHGMFTERHEVEVRDAGAVESLDRELAGLAARTGAASVPEQPDGEGSRGA